MGLYIKGMKMPTGGTIIAVYKINGKLYATRGLSGRLYPLVPVPPHGRCIDADALTISTAVPLDGKPYRYVHIDNLDNAPTIISSEKDKT